MPMRQDTFRLVPTTLVNKTIPRPPMTSKAAKKAYREATRLPKVSKAEQRRLEREELARQKREYEKERAAAKAKAVREKKQLKEKEERERRKKEGLPEPNRYVRASQPTIKLFVKSGSGGKRSWEEADNGDIKNDENGTLIQAYRALGPLGKTDSLAMADVLSEIFETEHDLGRTSSPSQHTPLIPQTVERHRKPTIPLSSPQIDCFTPCPKRSRSIYRKHPTQQIDHGKEQLDPLKEKCDNNRDKVASKAHSSVSKAELGPEKGVESLEAHLDNTAAWETRRQTHHVTPLPVIPAPQSIKSTASAYSRSCGQSREERPRIMPPPPLPLSYVSVGNQRFRRPLGDLSTNMASSARPNLSKPAISKGRVVAVANRARVQDCSTPLSSTQAFLEAHMDDFFPSPSQQVRELMDDVDDVPSNTQIAREIDATPALEPTQCQFPQSQVEAIDLSFFSSQDFVISSQDLRDIDTPRALPLETLCDDHAIDPSSRPLCLAGSQKQPLVLDDMAETADVTESQYLPRSRQQPKPRFFEEKEEDLLYAALHESFLMTKEKLQSSSPKRSQRTSQRVKSVKTDDVKDEFGFEDFDVDPEFLAALDGVEKGSLHSSFICIARV